MVAPSVARSDARSVPWRSAAAASHAAGPTEGFIGTANDDPVGATADGDPLDGAPYPYYYGALFDPGARAHRVRERLGALAARGDVTMDDMGDVAADGRSELAVLVLDVLLGARDRRPDLVSARTDLALDVLADWRDTGDYDCAVDHAGPTVFHAWAPHVVRGLLRDDIGPELTDEQSNSVWVILSRDFAMLLADPAYDPSSPDHDPLAIPWASGRNWYDDTETSGRVETMDEVMLAALDAALADLAALAPERGWDPDAPATWAWGDHHTIDLDDPIGDLLPEASSASAPVDACLFTVDRGDAELMWGGAAVPTADVSEAPSQRFVAEMIPGAVRASNVLPGGQSERPGDPHFMDQWPLYLANETREMPFYRDEVDAARERTLVLPAGYPYEGSPEER